MNKSGYDFRYHFYLFNPSLFFGAFKHITAVLAAKVLRSCRALNLPRSACPHPPNACLALIFQRALQVTRRPVILIVQRTTINKFSLLEKGRYLPLIQRNVTGTATLRFFGMEARDGDSLNITRGGRASGE
ncbi:MULTISPECIES: hypothetical protein [Pseudomonas]|uniref:hypothetical protein n=1 Tax=Pseudomonas TaxID=286 RepID=UPI001586341A|nr:MULTISPECIES: hypothetical protein [unclassified Pseudomonas]MBP2870753.1 hypothetical protein [Pseudomonas sp. SWRI144]MBW8128576.1 hypothetical protein [Pseudomonas sp. LAP_36]MBW8137868.1 hypothetical protein [Pseudomonas sp. PAMC 26818]